MSSLGFSSFPHHRIPSGVPVALLGDLDLALREQTGLAISVADDSMNCVALGTGKSLEFERQLAHVIDYGT